MELPNLCSARTGKKEPVSSCFLQMAHTCLAIGSPAECVSAALSQVPPRPVAGSKKGGWPPFLTNLQTSGSQPGVLSDPFTGVA